MDADMKGGVRFQKSKFSKCLVLIMPRRKKEDELPVDQRGQWFLTFLGKFKFNKPEKAIEIQSKSKNIEIHVQPVKSRHQYFHFFWKKLSILLF